MAKKYCYNLDEIRGMIAFEGLGHTVLELGLDEIIDTRLRGKWYKARHALREIREYLKEGYK